MGFRQKNEIVTAFRRASARLSADRRGATAIFTGVAFSAVLGFAGLGTEVGTWYVAKRSMQGAADAAAYSAALAAMNTSPANALSDAITEARAVSAQYGFANGTNGVTVTVTNPPASPISASLLNNTSAYQVSIAGPQARLFSKLFVSSAMTISAQAIAATGATSDNCMLALNTGAVTGILVNGYVQANLNNCSIYSNATGNNSLVVNGNSSLTANSVSMGGTDTLNGAATLTATNGVKSNQSAMPDPYANRNVQFSGCDRTSTLMVQGSQPVTVAPSVGNTMVFCGGIRVNAGGTLNLTGGGIYVMDHSDFVANGGSVKVVPGAGGATGVTIVMASSTGSSNYGKFQINGSATVQLTAPTTGPTAGIAIYEDSNAPAGTVAFTGGSNLDISGVLYLPSQNVRYAGNTSSNCTQLIASTITLTGSSSFGNSCPNNPGLLTGFGGVPQLVE